MVHPPQSSLTKIKSSNVKWGGLRFSDDSKLESKENPRPPHVCKRKMKKLPSGRCNLPMVQIEWTKAESQQIVATRRLYCLQYPVQSLSRLQRIYSSATVNIRCKALARRPTCYGLRRKPIGTPTGLADEKIVRTSRVSSLEAFSCYPTHGSFSAMTCRSTEFTGHVSQWFLSYWIDLLLARWCNSRIKLTCLATV